MNEKTNRFVTGGIASLCDYIDIYYFKWLGEGKTLNQSIKLDVSTELSQPPMSRSSLDQEYESFQRQRDLGLPLNYDPERWWEDTKEELVKLFLESINKDYKWYENLKIGDPSNDKETAEFEAFTMLQLEAEEYLSGIYRPDKVNDTREDRLNTDARFKSFNKELIPNCYPTIVDIKVPIDPASLFRVEVRTLAQQVDDMVNSVKFQQIRAKTEFNETVLHVINLFRIRPIDRYLFIVMFKAKAIEKGVDLNCILFLNTRDDAIY